MAEQGNGGFVHSLYENMFLLLIVGLVIPIVSYTVWGLVEIVSEPQLDVDKYMSELKPAAAPAPVEAQPAAPAPEAAPAQPEQAK